VIPSGGRRGLQLICGGGGIGIATVVEREDYQEKGIGNTLYSGLTIHYKYINLLKLYVIWKTPRFHAGSVL
jgi:hypothetical protein